MQKAGNENHHVARTVAAAVLGCDPGPLAAAESLSHHVYVGADIVVKIIDSGRNTRLDREIALAPHLPRGLTAPLLAGGLEVVGGREIRYACYARMPGATPGMDLPGVDEATARSLAEQAVQRLGTLHGWTPPASVRLTLAEELDDGGFAGRAPLAALIEKLPAAVPSVLLDGLAALAESAPAHVNRSVPVHADSHWGNWLADDGRVTTLLDFEWARFGEPLDDWFFVISLSGGHRDAVLDVVTRETEIDPEALRAGCELRHATYLAADILLALSHPDDVPAGMLDHRLRGLNDIVAERCWWRPWP